MTQRRFLAVWTLALLLGGCGPSLLQRPADPAAHTYVLEWQGDPGSRAMNPSGPVLLVSSVLAAPGFDTSDMVFVRQAHEIEYFARHHWVDAPARMLEPLLMRAAAQTGLFRDVVEAGSGARADLRLESRLLNLQQVFRVEPGQVQLALHATLIDIASSRVLASRTLSFAEPVAEQTPYGGVEAANRAVARLLAALQDFLAGQVDEAPG